MCSFNSQPYRIGSIKIIFLMRKLLPNQVRIVDKSDEGRIQANFCLILLSNVCVHICNKQNCLVVVMNSVILIGRGSFMFSQPFLNSSKTSFI